MSFNKKSKSAFEQKKSAKISALFGSARSKIRLVQHLKPLLLTDGALREY